MKAETTEFKDQFLEHQHVLVNKDHLVTIRFSAVEKEGEISFKAVGTTVLGKLETLIETSDRSWFITLASQLYETIGNPVELDPIHDLADELESKAREKKPNAGSMF